MRKLPPQLAQRIAFFLKGPAGTQGSQSAPSGGTPAGASAQGSNSAPGPNSTPGRSGSPDFQQMINRLPAVSLAELHKDDAVMILSTNGTRGHEVTAITLLSGVEPILTASPHGAGPAAPLSGWDLS